MLDIRGHLGNMLLIRVDFLELHGNHLLIHPFIIIVFL